MGIGVFPNTGTRCFRGGADLPPPFREMHQKSTGRPNTRRAFSESEKAGSQQPNSLIFFVLLS